MENSEKKIALFSGRFDPPHVGHVVSILRILKYFDQIKIVLLDYEKRKFPSQYCLNILYEVLSGKNVVFFKNSTHFGKITESEISKFKPFDAYFAGNMAVLRHISSLGYRIEWIDRSYHYEATSERLADDLRFIIKNC